MNIDDVGKHFESNSLKLDEVTPVEWEIAFRKCKAHIIYRLKGNTKFGAHTAEHLGVPALEYYHEYTYSSIIFGHWEWKDDFDLTQQLVRIADSRISTVVESFRKAKAKNEKREKEGKYPLTTGVKSLDIEGTFYKLTNEEIDEEAIAKAEKNYKEIEQHITESKDDDIILFWECIKEGYKRDEIAQLMEKSPKQLDKIREKFLRQIRKVIEVDGNE
jgi:hypothetical protein